MLNKLILVSSLSVAFASAKNEIVEYAKINLPNQVTVEAPKSWWIHGGTLRAAISSYTVAKLNFSGFKISKEDQSTSIFTAASMPRSTYASLSVSIHSPLYTEKELFEAGKEDLKELTLEAKKGFKESLKVGGYNLIEMGEFSKINIEGSYGLKYDYVRTGNKGNVKVKIYELVVKDKEVRFQFAYRISEKAMWMPVINHMINSIIVEEPAMVKALKMRAQIIGYILKGVPEKKRSIAAQKLREEVTEGKQSFYEALRNEYAKKYFNGVGGGNDTDFMIEILKRATESNEMNSK